LIMMLKNCLRKIDRTQRRKREQFRFGMEFENWIYDSIDIALKIQCSSVF
jgi:hypothetical protein